VPVTAADKVEIIELLSRYNRYADALRIDELLTLFIPDAEIVSPIGTVRGHAAIAEARNKMTNSRHAARLRGGQHWVGNVIIDDAGEDEATVYADHVMIKPGGEGGNGVITVVGAYNDLVRKVEGRWLFARREVSTMGMPEVAPPAASS
jgi:hypothetical protein